MPAPGDPNATSSVLAVEPQPLDAARHGEAAGQIEAVLRAKVVGQDDAINAVVELYQIFLAGMCSPDRPVGNLLFLGPTGSGKTYVVEALADALFANPQAFVKVNCAEFQQQHEIAKLIGSPPGYVGHGQTPPLLTQDALNHWHTDKLKLTLLLFDEIEKASEALWQLLLGILDRASLTLGDNSHVDLSRCLIFMTSNLGASEMSSLAQGGMGFAAKAIAVDGSFDQKISRTALEAARKKFSPEFINRLDKVVVFRTLRMEQLEQILELELNKVQQRITRAVGQSHFTFDCAPELKRWLLQEGTDPRYGARHLKRVIEKNLVYGLANLVATGQIQAGDRVLVGMKPEGGLSFAKVPGVVNGAGSRKEEFGRETHSGS